MISSPIRRSGANWISSGANSFLRNLGRAAPTYRNAPSHYALRTFTTSKVAKPTARSVSKTAVKPASPARTAATATTPAKTTKPVAAAASSPSKPATPPARPQPTSASSAAVSDSTTQSLTDGLYDEPVLLDEGEKQVDWSRSFHGLSQTPFSKEAAEILLEPIDPNDVEVKPDGIIYLPEIKYRRILNRAFGPGAWGLAPRGETIVTPKNVTREYGLVVHGR
jgi:Mitochondrial genome maintenance MGM101